MRVSPLWTIIAALIAVVVVGAAAARLLDPPRPLLSSAGLSLAQITSDNNALATTIHYTLNRNAAITITFQNKAGGAQYVFRNAEPRAVGDYQVSFSGVVGGYTLPNEQIAGTIETRLIPNGVYTWTISAKGDAINGSSAEIAQISGDLTINKTDTALPLVQDFSVSPTTFTPNQDGIDDRVEVNAYLTKKAALTVFLQDASGARYYVSERVENRQPGDMGAHVFDYDGGVDNNVTPPPDGTYTLVALAEDAEGQRIRRTSQVTLKQGGLPQVEIQPQTTGSTLSYGTQAFTGAGVRPPEGVTATQATIQMTQGDLLTFRLNVYNYGVTPIRTLGPWPGSVYTFDQQYAAYTNSEKASLSGAWHIGLQCETSVTSLPWRWAIGSPDLLTAVVDDKGQTFYYLMPGQSATVWGAVQMSNLVKTRNPQECWAALIYEDVAVDPLQSHVGAIKVELIPPP